MKADLVRRVKLLEKQEFAPPEITIRWADDEPLEGLNSDPDRVVIKLRWLDEHNEY
jgi:hypothetical protein